MKLSVWLLTVGAVFWVVETKTSDKKCRKQRMCSSGPPCRMNDDCLEKAETAHIIRLKGNFEIVNDTQWESFLENLVEVSRAVVREAERASSTTTTTTTTGTRSTTDVLTERTETEATTSGGTEIVTESTVTEGEKDTTPTEGEKDTTPTEGEKDTTPTTTTTAPSTETSTVTLTEASSSPNTETSTVSSTDASSSPSTETSTVSSTDASSSPSTETSMVSSTDASSSPSTETSTVSSTDASSSPSTETSTISSTDASSSPSTETSMVSSTDASSSPSTETSTVYSTESATTATETESATTTTETDSASTATETESARSVEATIKNGTDNVEILKAETLGRGEVQGEVNLLMVLGSHKGQHEDTASVPGRLTRVDLIALKGNKVIPIGDWENLNDLIVQIAEKVRVSYPEIRIERDIQENSGLLYGLVAFGVCTGVVIIALGSLFIVKHHRRRNATAYMGRQDPEAHEMFASAEILDSESGRNQRLCH